ncbi:esterase/lipase family protein [Planctomicrobium sp. SH668]|uniref:esterase/lipase family protein n=1 Tax=Planctomicrobium sp. SH668 TaxID=3448126 RepID=UPI003F5C1A0B
MRGRHVLIGMALLILQYQVARGYSDPSQPASAKEGQADVAFSIPHFNIETPTLGGRQFWGDVHFFRGYRIQHNVLTDHYRLIDGNDIRQAWGTRPECEAALEKIKTDQQLAPMSGRVVIVIHGIIRSSKSFETLKTKLVAQGHLVVGFDYPSTRVSLSQCAHYFKETISSLNGVEQIDLVVHSMGGLLVRTYLQEAGANRDPRFRRLVMMGVPNHGAKMANLMKDNWLFQFGFGPAGQQLVEDATGFISKLPVPDFEFGTVSGIRGNPDGWNPLIPGEDDGTVSLESSRLAGASDSIEIPCLHSSMMWNKDVIAATVRFLESGAFRDSGEKVPIRKTVSVNAPAVAPLPEKIFLPDTATEGQTSE